MNPVPHHLAIIMDGNRRWARKRRLPTLFGHKRGSENLDIIGEAALKRGVKVLSVWAFSTENWKRTKREVTYLMKLLGTVKDKIETFQRMKVRVVFSGRIHELSKDLQQTLRDVSRITRRNTRGILNIAINYGGHAELADAFTAMTRGKRSRGRITPAQIELHLCHPELPMPDLIIRTGDEQRLSGFMSWQSAYAELFFSKKMWPEFTVRDLAAAIRDYQKRDRRYGGNTPAHP